MSVQNLIIFVQFYVCSKFFNMQTIWCIYWTNLNIHVSKLFQLLEYTTNITETFLHSTSYYNQLQFLSFPIHPLNLKRINCTQFKQRFSFPSFYFPKHASSFIPCLPDLEFHHYNNFLWTIFFSMLITFIIILLQNNYT